VVVGVQRCDGAALASPGRPRLCPGSLYTPALKAVLLAAFQHPIVFFCLRLPPLAQAYTSSLLPYSQALA